MNSKLHQDFNMLEKELKVLKSNPETSHDVQNNYQQISKNETKISSNLAKIKETEDRIKKINNNGNGKSQITDINKQLSELSEKLIKKGDSVEKEIKDEMELLLIGMNNINHYIEGLINENDRITTYIDDKFDTVNKTIKFNVWLTIILVLMIIAEVFLFFNF